VKPSTQRVLGLLQGAGAAGVSTGQFAEARCPRASARIAELRELGYDVETRRERANAFRFVLHGAPAVGVGGAHVQVKRSMAPSIRAADPSSEAGQHSTGPRMDPREPGAVRLFEVPPLGGMHDREAA
jgi:hypothetical protein